MKNVYYTRNLIESDTENYMKWRFCGGTLKLKKGAVPTKFECQKTKRASSITRSGYDKRQKIDFYENLLTKEVRPSVVQQDTEFISVENAPENLDEPINPLPIDNTIVKTLNIENKKTKDKRIQVEQEKKHVQTQTLKKRENVKTPSTNLESSFSTEEKDCSSSSDSESLYYSDSIETCEMHFNSQKNTILKIESNSKLYLGIPKQSYFVINLLIENVRCPFVNILITLKKIKLNDSYQRLEIDFNTKNVSRIFRKTVVLLAKCFKQLIYFPTKEAVKEKLPIPFRRRYNNTVCIIDCFEIRIEKPSNALHQALSWSQYKGCNTIKYLISITPDGTINFVSDGYGGRVTDTDIFEDCKILERMPKGSAIMADRGFKTIASDVQMHGCHLVRPPSVSTTKASTKEEVIETKRIAALRIHVERAIGRIREFKMTSPHACIDTKVIDMLDDVVIISCGLVNLQSNLV
ncbi:hypothetical protein ACJJTC_001197 [Scirpophaga incertulas]